MPWPAVLAWGVAAASACLAISGQPWKLTLLIGLAGVLFVGFPPARTMPMPLYLASGALLVLGGTAFLPADWFHAPYLRVLADHQIALPRTLSPQPCVSWEAWTLLLTSLLWAWLCLEMPLNGLQRKRLAAGYLLALLVVAVNTIAHGTSIEDLVPGSLRQIGQFQNRNQTGDLLVMGGIFSAALGFGALARQSAIGFAWIAGTGIFLLALMRDGSRAAGLLFGVGLLLLLLLMPEFRRQSRGLQGIIVVITLLVIALFISLDVHLRERILHSLTHAQDARLPIFHDTVAMVLRGPWCGAGLGNFEGVFNIQRDQSGSLATRCLHPDSDWLWLAAELGWGGAGLVLCLVVMFFRFYLMETPYPVLGRASLVVAILFVLHSLVDVGAHRLGTFWSCIYLVSLGAGRPALEASRKPVQAFARLGGICLLVLAALRIQSAGMQPWMPTMASLPPENERLMARLPATDKQAQLGHCIAWAPLNWLSYHQRGLLEMQAQPGSPTAELDFARALFLEQNSTELPLAIGEACRRSDLDEAMRAWQELIRRSGPRRAEFLQNLYWTPGLDAKTRLLMTSLAGDDPNLQIIAIVNQFPPEFGWLRENFLTANPSLTGVEPAVARRLFDYWFQVGDVPELLTEWPQHAAWQTPGWRAYARALASAGRYDEAVSLVLARLPGPPLPAGRQPVGLSDAERQANGNAHDPFYSIQLLFSQLSVNDNADALATLQSLALLPEPPAYLPYLLGKTLAATGQNEAAWHALEPQLDAP